jgi:hypothetical protein
MFNKTVTIRLNFTQAVIDAMAQEIEAEIARVKAEGNIPVCVVIRPGKDDKFMGLPLV